MLYSFGKTKCMFDLQHERKVCLCPGYLEYNNNSNKKAIFVLDNEKKFSSKFFTFDYSEKRFKSLNLVLNTFFEKNPNGTIQDFLKVHVSKAHRLPLYVGSTITKHFSNDDLFDCDRVKLGSVIIGKEIPFKKFANIYDALPGDFFF